MNKTAASARALRTLVSATLVAGAFSVGGGVATHARAATTVDNCGYPVGTTGLPSTVFNEDTLATWIQVNGSGASQTVSAYANDENGVLLGVTDTTSPATVTPFAYAGDTTLTSEVDHNTNYTQLSVNPLPVAYASGDQLTLTSGTQSFNVHLSANAPAGATTLQTQQFNPNQNYTVGSGVADTNVDQANPYGAATNPSLGDTTKLDASNRPQYPALFVTNLTVDGNTATSGDWQQGGTPQTNLANIFGIWVAGDYNASNQYTRGTLPSNHNQIAGSNPNAYDYGPGSDAATGTLNSAQHDPYGLELRWNVSSLKDDHGLPLAAGSSYRFQVLLHDGDQNKTGGDAGELCTTLSLPMGPPPATPSVPWAGLVPLLVVGGIGGGYLRQRRKVTAAAR